MIFYLHSFSISILHFKHQTKQPLPQHPFLFILNSSYHSVCYQYTTRIPDRGENRIQLWQCKGDITISPRLNGVIIECLSRLSYANAMKEKTLWIPTMSINKYYNIRNVVIMQQPYTMQGYHELAKVSRISTVQNEVLYDKNRCQPLPCWRELIYEQMAHAWRNGPVGDPSHYTSISPAIKHAVNSSNN